MAGPIDYLGAMPQVNLGESLLSGLQAGAALREVRNRNLAEDRAAQYSADLQNTFANPTAQNFAALRLKYPEQSEAIGQGWKDLSEAQKSEEFGSGIRVYQALKNNNPDAANRVLDEQIIAMENSGQDATDLRNIKDSIARDPRATSNQVAFYLSSVDPDRWKKMMDEQRTAEAAPYELSEKASKAQKAAIDSKYAESKAAQDLEKGGWDIAKLQNDINVSRQNTAIAAMNASLAKEQNQLKRQELQQKIDDAQVKRDDAIRQKSSAIEQSRSTIDNSLSTIDRILKNPALNSVLGSVEGSEFYPSTAVGLLPGTASADDRINALSDIDTLKSQTFINQLQAMKQASATGAAGLGGTTEKEVDKLINSIQSLNTRQGEKQFKDNLQEFQRILLKGRKNLADRYGVPESIPDRPAKAEPQGAPQGFRVLGVEGQ